MKLISVTLDKHKYVGRLMGISRITLTFNEIIQLFLGSNGSGKSALMYEMSMLPGDQNRFRSGGSKISTAEADDGRTYTATTIFEPHTRCRLVRHDEEGDMVLNDWGTISAQRTLVEQIFKITPDVRKLQLGKERFSQMGPGKRREWFMRLCNANYDYALAVYKKFKDEANGLTRDLSSTKKRLVAEQGKAITPEEEQKLNREVNDIHRELNHLMERRSPVKRPSSTFEEQQKQQLAELDALTRRLYPMRFIAPYGNYRYGNIPRDERHKIALPSFLSLEEINGEIERFKSEVMSRDALINKAVQEHDRLKGQLDILMKTGEEGLAQLHARFKAVHYRKIEFLAQRTLVDELPGLDTIHPINGMGALESLWETLDELCSSIPDNHEKVYGQARLVELNEQLAEKTKVFNVANSHLDKLQVRKAHADQHRGNGETTCPQCSYRWTVGYNENEYQRLLNGIAVYEEQVKVAKEAIKDIEEQIAKNYEYGEKYRSFVRLTRSWPVLNPLWDYLIEKEYIVTKARTMMGFVDRFRHDLQIMKDALRMDAEMGEISHLIESAEKLGDASLTDVRLGVEQWTGEIEILTSERHLLQQDVLEYQAYYRQMAEGVELGKKIVRLRGEIETTNQEWIDTIYCEGVLHCIRQLQTALARKEEILSYVTIQKALVQDLEEQIRSLTIREEAAHLVVRELSPTEGLIADGLLGFIRSFVGRMNEVIKSIWSYPLVVQDCAIESHGGTELDYKFPMIVNDQEEPIEDVSEGSTGIIEIIDLSYRITALQCLGLGNGPLYLDEFGASFDTHHQAAATIAISNIMEERQFSQLFMVSHYEASYGAMTNAEVCVLCPSNITIPSGTQYNQHVEMEIA